MNARDSNSTGNRVRLGARISSVVALCALLSALGVAVFQMPERWAYVESMLPITSQWDMPDEQYRAITAPAPYDLLKAADAALPLSATVLLVTPGRDIGRAEYITYHRALYFLAPRPVWWTAPTPPDGTWKSRWWLPAPLTPESLRAVAAEKGADYLLAYRLEATNTLGSAILADGGSYLVRLGDARGAAPPTESAPQASHADSLWPLRVAAGALVMWLFGGMVLAVVRRLGYRTGRVEAVALGWALGSGVVSVLMLWLSALGVRLDGQLVILTVAPGVWSVWCLVTGARGEGVPSRALRFKSALPLPHARPDSGCRSSDRGAVGIMAWLAPMAGALLLLIVVAQSAVVALMAIGKPLEVWDSWVNWTMKARIIFLDGYISPAVYADASRAVTHLDYPLMVPLAQAWFFGWLGAPDDRLVGVPSLLFYLSLVGICYGVVRAAGAGRPFALLAAAVAATIADVAGLAGIVFAEMPLAVFTAVAALYLLKWLEGGEAGALLIAALGAGLALWTKKEGVLLLMALCVAALALNFARRRAWLGVGALACGAAVVAGPWWAFTALNGIVKKSFMPVTLDNFVANSGRLPEITQLESDSLLSGTWSYIWPFAGVVSLVAIVGWMLRVRRMRGEGAGGAEWVLPLAAGLYICLVPLVYIFSDFAPYQQHVLSSVHRLLAPPVPLLVVWLALVAWRSEQPVRPPVGSLLVEGAR